MARMLSNIKWGFQLFVLICKYIVSVIQLNCKRGMAKNIIYNLAVFVNYRNIPDSNNFIKLDGNIRKYGRELCQTESTFAEILR